MKRLIAFTLALILVLAVIPSGLAGTVIEVRYEEMYVPTLLQGLKMYLPVPDSLVLKDVGVICMTIHERPYNFFAIQYEAIDEQGEIFDDWLLAAYTTDMNSGNENAQGALMATKRIKSPLIIANSEEATAESRDMVLDDFIELVKYYTNNLEACRTSEDWYTLSTKGLFY